MGLGRILGGLAFAVALVAPDAARADLFAAAGVTGADGSPDVAVLNATTGKRVTLPAGVNTAAQEIQPSISTSGERLTFLRLDPAGGTTRVVVTDLGTGQSADLFNGFEAAQRPPSDPELRPDGGVVYTTGPFVQEGTAFFPDILVTGLEQFPGGPFGRRTHRPGPSFSATGRTTHPSASDNLFLAYGQERPGTKGEVVLSRVGGAASTPLGRGGHSYSHPAIPAAAPQQVLFVDRPVSSAGATGAGDIVFRPAALATFPGTPTALPPIVNSGDESLPAFTSDARYVGFVRRSGGRDRLFVWDSQTQTLLNTAGVDLGALATGETGNLSLYTQSLFASATVGSSGAVSARLTQPSGVGLFVQRIVGNRRVLGRRAYRLRTVGRVPLGSFKRGRLRTHWNLRVAGKRLRPGRYLVTVRGVTATHVVRELGKPRVLRVRRR